jgi:uncharacterized RDD family membrane protein YckC
MSTFERRGFRDQLSIETPEQVELTFDVAGIGSRAVGAIIDVLILVAFYVAVIVALVLLASSGSAVGGKAGEELDTAGKWAIAIIIFLNFLLVWGYFVLFEALWRGQTPGKRVMKLRVIQDSGRQITFFEALARNLLRFIDYMPGIYFVGFVAMLCNRRNKRLGDLVAGTLVVREPRDEQPLLTAAPTSILGQSTAPTATPSLSAPSATPWVRPVEPLFPADAIARLTAQDLLVIDTFFGRVLDLALDTRAQMAARIAQQMCAKMQQPLPGGPDAPGPERVLEAIAHQMRSTR